MNMAQMLIGYHARNTRIHRQCKVGIKFIKLVFTVGSTEKLLLKALNHIERQRLQRFYCISISNAMHFSKWIWFSRIDNSIISPYRYLILSIFGDFPES